MIPTSRSDVDLKWVPVSVARMMLMVSRQRVYQLINVGALVAQNANGTILVSQRSVEARIALLLQEGAAIDGYR